MAFEPYTRVDFGPAKASLKTIGYTLIKAGRPIGPRVDRGIEDLGKGQYGAVVGYPSHFRGQLVWDTGGPSPQTVAYEVTPEQGAVLIGTGAVVKRAAPPARRPAPRVRVAPPPFASARSMLEPCEAPPYEPAVDTIESLPVRTRIKTIVVSAAPCPSIAWTMVDANGCPVDLSACCPGAQCPVMGTLRIAPDCYNYAHDFGACATDPAAGLMVADIDPALLGGPGLYVAEMGVWDCEGTCVAVVNKFFLLIEPSLFGQGIRGGPPTIAEIRLELRDSSALESELLDDSLYWSNSEIVAAMRAPVDYWNESLPPIPPSYTTQNFPFRYWWKQGIKAMLFRIAAEWHRRNQVAYSAGGVSFDEHGMKAQQYDQAADAIWAEYKQWVQQKKISANLEQAWGEVGSDYARWSHPALGGTTW
jgi:hypothetical protein